MIDKSLQPTEKRKPLTVDPTGWKNKEYDPKIVSDKYIYNRAHLIGFQLTGENNNRKNLMTGTRSFNVNGMLPFENIVDDYVGKGGKVLYRVTPVFVGDELVARGVYMEAQSLDSNKVSFNIYVFNVQDGIEIDYKTGENWLK